VERTCDACGAKWLLSHRQASFSKRPIARSQHESLYNTAMTGMNIDIFSQESEQLADSVGSQVAVKAALRSCPRCQSREFTERKVTDEHPASPDASRALLVA
jgi:hypothetical protein